jgi:SPP1 family phage portal protein
MIQWNKETLEKSDSVAQILPLAETEWNSRRELYERIRRKTSYSEIVSKDDNKIKVAFESYINSMVTGYFAGKAPVYDVEKVSDPEKLNIIKELLNKVFNTDSNKDEELKTLVDYISKYNDEATEFFDLAFDYFGMRACYEALYENDENEIVYTKQSALNTIGIFDYETPVNQIGQLRKWTEKDKNNVDITIVELTTINGKKYYTPTPEDVKKLKEMEEKKEPRKWNMLPCIAIENEMGLSCFELVISLICAYERVIQNSRNTFQYNDDAKLKITGYEPKNELMITKLDKDGNPELDENGQAKQVVNKAREEEDKATLEMKVFYTPDKSGDIAWVEKSVQDTALQNHKKTLIDLISMISGVPNITDLGFTNADNASALDRKFFALEQMITSADKQFKKALLRRWETIIDRINKRKHKQYDFRSIKIDLQRNLPTDKGTETDRALKLRGLLSDASVIDMLPDDLDSISELEKVNKQNQENIEKNIENMQKIGQDTSNKILNTQENNKQYEVKKENIKQSDTITKGENKDANRI